MPICTNCATWERRDTPVCSKCGQVMPPSALPLGYLGKPQSPGSLVAQLTKSRSRWIDAIARRGPADELTAETEELSWLDLFARLWDACGRSVGSYLEAINEAAARSSARGSIFASGNQLHIEVVEWTLRELGEVSNEEYVVQTRDVGGPRQLADGTWLYRVIQLSEPPSDGLPTDETVFRLRVDSTLKPGAPWTEG